LIRGSPGRWSRAARLDQYQCEFATVGLKQERIKFDAKYTLRSTSEEYYFSINNKRSNSEISMTNLIRQMNKETVTKNHSTCEESRTFRVFKLSHEQLESLLPLSAFDGLDTAVAAVCHAMNSDKCHDELGLRTGLKKSFTVLSKSPLEVLKDIRQWALGCLKDEAIQDMNRTPLQSPSLNLIQGDFQTHARELTAHQARGILANVFFANCLDPMLKEKDTWNQGGLDWRPLLDSEFDSVGTERMRCHLLYFEASSSTEDDGSRRIIFERIRYKPKDFFGSSSSSSPMNTALPPVGTGVVLHGAVMESPPRTSTAFVNFANPNFG